MVKNIFLSAWVCSACLLTACTTPKVTGMTTGSASVEVSTTKACSAYAGALSILAVAKAQNRLTKKEVDSIDKSMVVANSVCLAKTPPANGISIVQSATSSLIAMEK